MSARVEYAVEWRYGNRIVKRDFESLAEARDYADYYPRLAHLPRLHRADRGAVVNEVAVRCLLFLIVPVAWVALLAWLVVRAAT